MNERHKQRQIDTLIRCRVPMWPIPFTFNYSRHYWIVRGLVPVEVAWKIYKDPASEHIRVDGHCMNAEPIDPWIERRLPDGTKLLSMNDKLEFEQLKMVSDPDFHNRYMRNFTFSDDPEVINKAKSYVGLYHIDSEVGLRVFVDYLRWYKLI